ncbi:MAG: glycosyltransferase family 1 protein [Acidobacteria bacterium]|nr:glycosyltransferase family 1 protein [Acidobacteriota bacterium]
MSESRATVAPVPPLATYEDLLDVATNLRWTWKIDARRLFAALDPSASPGALEWPQQLLLGLGRERVNARIASDPAVSELANAVVDNFRSYFAPSATTWFATHHRHEKDQVIAFFAAEFSLTDSLPIFAGGLGTVAAEQLKAASALGLPLVGVGLLYRGTSHQWLDREGRQHEAWDMMSPDKMPIERARDAQGRLIQVTVSLPGRDIQVAVYRARVGRNQLILLDSAVTTNDEADRILTTRLYDSDLETRLSQELILGIGGMRALAALSIEPAMLHLNEGHSVFAILERIRRVMANEGLSFEEAQLAVRPGLLFTTHTPVAAGHDYFPDALARRYLAPYARQLATSLDVLVALGRVTPTWEGDTFCPTVFAMRMVGHRNGVSRLHGRVTREQWSALWPRVPFDEIPVGHVTNGVHLESWVTGPFSELLTSTVGAQWQTTPGDPVMWSKIVDAPDADLWRVKNEARAELVEFARRRARKDLARRHSPAERVAAVSVLDPQRLTIGFIGRFVAYKRPTLLLRDPERLARILKNPGRSVQIVFAGKAHPNDEGGKQLLQDMIEFAATYDVADRVVFIVDFDTTLDRHLAQGADVWLNTPRRPLEACGVGGMKAGMNGALSFSTIDGWWDEATHDADPGAAPIGFSIGTELDYRDEALQDERDAASIYEVLENEIVPRFYERDERDVPTRWLASVKQSMSTLAPTWDSLRMTRDYTESYYLPGIARAAQLRAGGATAARERARDLRRLRAAWGQLRVEVDEVAARSPGQRISLRVKLADLEPADITVQLWVDDGVAAHVLDATLVDRVGPRARYEAPVDAQSLAAHVVLAGRVVPSNIYTDGEVLPGMMTWS